MRKSNLNKAINDALHKYVCTHVNEDSSQYPADGNEFPLSSVQFVLWRYQARIANLFTVSLRPFQEDQLDRKIEK